MPYLATIQTSRKNKESSLEPERPIKRKTFPYKPDAVSEAVYPDKHNPSLATPGTPVSQQRKLRGSSRLNLTPNKESAKFPPTHHTKETMSMQPQRVRDYSRGNLDGLLKFRASDQVQPDSQMEKFSKKIGNSPGVPFKGKMKQPAQEMQERYK